MSKIIGRHDEIQLLEKIYQSTDSEFVAVYGRRRVGKTFLIKNFFEEKDCMVFRITGQKKASMAEQLYKFTRQLEAVFFEPEIQLKEPKNWDRAFELLTKLLKEKIKDKKVVLFFDELPWLATKKSKLIQALDYYWNQHWVDMNNLKLIVCGSAASWMIDKIINDKGGLHNRITKTLLLEPFTLRETKEYLHSRGIRYLDKQILEVYMVMGGVPFYLKEIEKGLSVPQNIDRICFHKKGLLFSEFQNLFASLFDKASIHEKLIHIISKSRRGLTGKEMSDNMRNITSGGSLYKRLEELEAAGFILGFVPYGFHRKNKLYRIIDEYTLFYLSWIDLVRNKLKQIDKSKGYWEDKVHSQAWKSWAGHAFEDICLKHLSVIKKKLNIKASALADSWQYISKKGSKEEGAQIDLLFDRDDDVITICEIKHYTPAYVFNKEEAHKLQRRVEIFKKVTKTTKQIQLALITVNPIKPTMYSEELIIGNVTMYDFFNLKKYMYRRKLSARRNVLSFCLMLNFC